MGFFTDLKKYSYSLSDKELMILKHVVSLVEDGLPFDKRPSTQLDRFNGIDVKWAPMMIFEDDSTFGMWTYLNHDTVFIRPEETPYTANRIDDSKLTKIEKSRVNSMKIRFTVMDAQFKNIKTLNKELTLFMIYLLESDGHTVSTVLHELWHRHQFMHNPLHYFLSCIMSNLMDYEKSCEKSWSIEYDVRKKVDNYELKTKLRNLYIPFYEYLTILNRSQAPGISDEEKKELDEKLDEFDDTTKQLIKIIKL